MLRFIMELNGSHQVWILVGWMQRTVENKSLMLVLNYPMYLMLRLGLDGQEIGQ